jgi:hypothetical protein
MGMRVLGTLCRFSLDLDSAARHAKERFLAHSVAVIVGVSFVLGFAVLGRYQQNEQPSDTWHRSATQSGSAPI